MSNVRSCIVLVVFVQCVVLTWTWTKFQDWTAWLVWKYFSLEWSPPISKLPSLTGLQCLCNLSISWLGISEIPNLSRLEQLQVIKGSENRQQTSLQGLADLPALKQLNLWRCIVMSVDFKHEWAHKPEGAWYMRHGVELHEEDMRMLQGSQLLEPVLVMCGDFQYCGTSIVE